MTNKVKKETRGGAILNIEDTDYVMLQIYLR